MGRRNAAAEAEGSQSGNMISLVNAIADAIADDYPNFLMALSLYWTSCENKLPLLTG